MKFLSRSNVCLLNFKEREIADVSMEDALDK